MWWWIIMILGDVLLISSPILTWLQYEGEEIRPELGSLGLVDLIVGEALAVFSVITFVVHIYGFGF